MKVKVANITFSKNKKLREILNYHFTDVTFNDLGKRYNGDDLIDFLYGADMAIIGLEHINENILKNLPSLKFISKYGVGLDNIDLKACEKYNVQIGWTQGLNIVSVAEIVIGYMLSLSRNIYLTSNMLKKNIWLKDGGNELSGKTVGIIGLGNIGQKVVEFLKPFNCTILVNDIVERDSFIEKNNLIKSSKDLIYKKSDIISIHTPLTNKTFELINKVSLKKMKKNTILINTARGGIVSEDDLYWALTNGIISSAALDVYSSEPPTNMSLINLDNLICTPHIAGNSIQSVMRMGESAIKHLVEYKNSKL